MATIRMNALTNGLSGAIGNLVFRQVRGKTILSCKGSPPRKQSEKQRENRQRFRSATAYAKAAMLYAEKKDYYTRQAKKLKLPNAYTAAITDYMRKGATTEIDTRQCKGKAGNIIRVCAKKKDFDVNKVDVTLLQADGRLIESGLAIKKAQGVFLYSIKQNFQEKMPFTVRVTLCDHILNKVTQEVLVE